jgi:2-haloacid dehalogenase
MLRRQFLNSAAATLAASSLPRNAWADSRPAPRFKAVALDGLAVFDLRPVAAMANQFFPEDGRALMDLWRSRQFEYQWLRALAGRYSDFIAITEESLGFATKTLNLQLTPAMRQNLISPFVNLKAWPDAADALGRLHQAGVRLAFVSNMTEQMLTTGIRNSSLDGLFQHVLSTDRIRSYKPDPHTYQLGVDALRLSASDILFAPFAAWDLAGAKWFGYPAFWVNRANAVVELGVQPDGAGGDLNDLANFVLI